MKDYSLFACSDALQLNDSAFQYIQTIDDAARKLGVTLTHLGYSWSSMENDDNLYESAFSPISIQRLRRRLRQKDLSDLLLWSDPEKIHKPPNLFLDAEMIDTEWPNGYKYVSIHFPRTLVPKGSTEAFSFTSELLSSLNHMGRLDYALITRMESSTPPPYFRGIFAPGLTEQEELNLATWNRRYAERKIRLRGLYWGNLLSASHLARVPDRRELEKRLDNIEGCLRTTINGDDLFFMLPSADLSKSNVAPLEAFLRDHDLLMEPDDEARQTVRSLRY